MYKQLCGNFFFLLEATFHIFGIKSVIIISSPEVLKKTGSSSSDMWQPRGERVLSWCKNAGLLTKSFAPWHVDGLPCSSAESQHFNYPARWGCLGIWHILSKKHFHSDRVDVTNTFRGFSGLCFEGFVNIEIWVKPKLCYKICKSKIYKGVPICLDVYCIIGISHMEHL